MKVPVYDIDGKKRSDHELSDELFSLTVKPSVLHQVVVWQQAKKRAGTSSTKTTAEVSGGGKKPWRQKGTGRARSGSNRSPVWVGGGVVHGPKPKSWEQGLPKRVRKLGVRMALANRIQHDALALLDGLDKAQPKSKWGKDFCANFGSDQRVLVVAGNAERGESMRRAFANLPNCDVLSEAGLNVRDILNHQYCLIDTEAVAVIESRLAAGR